MRTQTCSWTTKGAVVELAVSGRRSSSWTRKVPFRSWTSASRTRTGPSVSGAPCAGGSLSEVGRWASMRACSTTAWECRLVIYLCTSMKRRTRRPGRSSSTTRGVLSACRQSAKWPTWWNTWPRSTPTTSLWSIMSKDLSLTISARFASRVIYVKKWGKPSGSLTPCSMRTRRTWLAKTIRKTV